MKPIEWIQLIIVHSRHGLNGLNGYLHTAMKRNPKLFEYKTRFVDCVFAFSKKMKKNQFYQRYRVQFFFLTDSRKQQSHPVGGGFIFIKNKVIIVFVCAAEKSFLF